MLTKIKSVAAILTLMFAALAPHTAAFSADDSKPVAQYGSSPAMCYRFLSGKKRI